MPGCVLQAVVDSMDDGRLLLYPQLLLTCLAMLPTTYTHLYILVVDLLQKVHRCQVFVRCARTICHAVMGDSPCIVSCALHMN